MRVPFIAVALLLSSAPAFCETTPKVLITKVEVFHPDEGVYATAVVFANGLALYADHESHSLRVRFPGLKERTLPGVRLFADDDRIVLTRTAASASDPGLAPEQRIWRKVTSVNGKDTVSEIIVRRPYEFNHLLYVGLDGPLQFFGEAPAELPGGSYKIDGKVYAPIIPKDWITQSAAELEAGASAMDKARKDKAQKTLERAAKDAVNLKDGKAP